MSLTIISFYFVKYLEALANICSSSTSSSEGQRRRHRIYSSDIVSDVIVSRKILDISIIIVNVVIRRSAATTTNSFQEVLDVDIVSAHRTSRVTSSTDSREVSDTSLVIINVIIRRSATSASHLLFGHHVDVFYQHLEGSVESTSSSSSRRQVGINTVGPTHSSGHKCNQSCQSNTTQLYFIIFISPYKN